MAKIIALTNQKGGVGKTTTCCSICGGLAHAGKKVLAIDLDPQGNLSFSLGVEAEDCYTIYDVFKGNCDISDAVQHGEICDVIPSNILLSGVELEGYEIHMGVTTLHEGASPLTTIRDHAKTTEEKQDGAYTSRVYGTYVHGVFDKEGVAEAMIRALGKKKGIDTSEMKGVDFQTFKETQYDILAAALREHLDMKAIYEILEAGV